jgi:hypothetical protein
MSLPTRFPGYDVLDKWDTPSWNEQTRAVVAERLNEVPERRFFSPDEWATLQAVCDRLIPQPDRIDAPVPIVPWIDQKLHKNQGNGYRYADMPPMREAWRRGIRGIEGEGMERFGGRFRDLAPAQQDEVLRRIQQGDVKAGSWRSLPAKRFFESTLLREVTTVYYAHPAAWNEIGFGGPAAPRGYVRLGIDRRDSWEAEERHER